MKISDITILTGVSPVKVSKRPSKKTLEFLNKLIIIKGLNDFVTLSRQQYGIPEQGLDIKPLIGYDLYAVGGVVINAYKLIVDEFVKRTGLPSEYTLEIFLVVVYNSIIDLKYFKTEPAEPIGFIFGRKEISIKMWNLQHEVGAIIIPYNASKTLVKKWLDKYWDGITDNMDNNFTDNPYVLTIHNNLLFEEEINNLKNGEGKSFTEITKLLIDKYPKEHWKVSRVKKIYYDVKMRNDLLKSKQRQ